MKFIKIKLGNNIIKIITSIFQIYSDDDGYSDGEEVDAGTDPLDENDFPSENDGGNGGDEEPEEPIIFGFDATLLIVSTLIGVSAIIYYKKRTK